jgi:signal peptidase I
MKCGMTERVRPDVVKEFLLSTNDHRVAGGSMRPTVHHGQKIALSPLSTNFIIGHIYIFIYNGRLLMHRLIAMQGQCAYFMGDHSFVVEKIPVTAVVAEYETNNHFPLLPIINFINTLCFLLGRKRGAWKIVQMVRIGCSMLLCRGR